MVWRAHGVVRIDDVRMQCIHSAMAVKRIGDESGGAIIRFT